MQPLLNKHCFINPASISTTLFAFFSGGKCPGEKMSSCTGIGLDIVKNLCLNHVSPYPSFTCMPKF